jgi:hypothetical protein
MIGLIDTCLASKLASFAPRTARRRCAATSWRSRTPTLHLADADTNRQLVIGFAACAFRGGPDI